MYGNGHVLSCMGLKGIERRPCVNSYEFVCLTQLCTIRACFSVLLGDSLIISLAQLVSVSVALPAELVLSCRATSINNAVYRQGKSFNPSIDTFCQQLKFPQVLFSKFPQAS